MLLARAERFLKLKDASEQMLKMAFPNAKNMQDALSQMQGMMGGMGGMPGRGPRGGSPFGGGGGGRKGLPAGGGQGSDAQLKAAMDMLQKIQKQNKR